MSKDTEYTGTAAEFAEVINRLNDRIKILSKALRRFGAYATQYNHGRARKVSFNHPSSRISRERLAKYWSDAVLQAERN